MPEGSLSNMYFFQKAQYSLRALKNSASALLFGAILSSKITSRKHKHEKHGTDYNPRRGYLFTAHKLKAGGEVYPCPAQLGMYVLGGSNIVSLCIYMQITAKWGVLFRITDKF